MRTRTTLLLLCLLLAAGSALAGDRKEKQTKDEVRKSLSEHLVGKWRWAESYALRDGKWAEHLVPDSVYESVLLRADGTAQHIRTFPGGQVAMQTSTWSTDEQAGTVTIAGAVSPVFRLTADEFGFSMTVGADPAKGIAGEERRWIFRRVDDKPSLLAEKLLGKWNYSKTYVKQDGEWTETASAPTTDISHEYTEGKVLMRYRAGGSEELSADLYWNVNCTTGEMRWGKDKHLSATVTVSLADDGSTMTVLYNETHHPMTGQTVTGQFKDVFVRGE